MQGLKDPRDTAVTIASVHVGSIEILQCLAPLPIEEDRLAELIGRTLAALDRALRPLRWTVRVGVPDPWNELGMGQFRSAPPWRHLDDASGDTEVASSVAESANAVLANARRDVDRNAVFLAWEFDSLALRAPPVVERGGDVTLETWSGERWVPVERRDEQAWLLGPWLDGVVPSPATLQVLRAGPDVRLSLDVNWSCWSAPDREAPTCRS